MKANFKQLGLATAVAAATAGYAGVAAAQTSIAGNGLGDMAIVPYYTTKGDFVTGVHIINTSDLTQVVKIRLRRASDSMDSLDFNLVMSPRDEWTGFINNGSPTENEDGDMVDDGQVKFNTSDTTCTVPAFINGQAPMPQGIFDIGAETGYIEVIGMGSADSSTPIYMDSKHVGGTPVNCDRVRENFNKDGVSGVATGVIDSLTSVQSTDPDGVFAGALTDTDYGETGNVLKVSYFIRDSGAGLEMGSDANHFHDFLMAPSITNQISGIFSLDMQGFDFPDLNGGAPASIGVGGAARGKFEELRTAFGTSELINDWSAKATDTGTVATDWVVTAPGQYNMLERQQWVTNTVGLGSSGAVGEHCDSALTDPATANSCDYRDIPLTASFTVYDREELGIVIDPDDLVFSPSIPGISPSVTLDQEVNVIKWAESSVLRANEFGGKVVDMQGNVPAGADNGWAILAISAADPRTTAVPVAGAQICDFVADENPAASPMVCTPVDDTAAIPVVGFVAWEREFEASPEANYGRIIDHSFTVSTSP